MTVTLQLPQLEAIVAAHPGATVNVIPVTEICMDAATKGTQTTFAVVEAMWSVITAGASPKIDEIATAINRGKARVSQIVKELISGGFKALKKCLILLYKAINSKTKLSDLTSMDPNELRAILEFLPEVARELDAESITPIEALETLDVLVGDMSEDQTVAILSQLPHTTLATLITALLPMLPADAVAWVLKDFIPKSLGPVPVPVPVAD